jgi:hypothetical protein
MKEVALMVMSMTSLDSHDAPHNMPGDVRKLAHQILGTLSHRIGWIRLVEYNRELF